MSETVGYVIVGVLLLAGAGAALAGLLLSTKRKRLVREQSQALTELTALNGAHRPTQYYPHAIAYNWVDTVNSKAKFDRYDLSRFFRAQLIAHEGEMQEQVDAILAAAMDYEVYQAASSDIATRLLQQTTAVGMSQTTFDRIERKLFSRELLPVPQQVARLTCTVRYTSPKGQNSYSRSYTWDFRQLLFEVAEMRRVRDEQSTAGYLRAQERQKMTADLRYQVLKRDNFRCRSCGATAESETLHVDHIHPVAKGGRTEMENLQVLCQTCNLGKSDRH